MGLKYALVEQRGKKLRVEVSRHRTKTAANKKKKELQRFTKKNFPRGGGGYKNLRVIKITRKKR